MRRLRSDKWITDDGQTWLSYAEAVAHQKFITLRARVDYLMRCSIGPDAFTKALLDTPQLHIVVQPRRDYE